MAVLSKGRLSILLLGAAAATTHLYTDDIAQFLTDDHDAVKITDPRYAATTEPVKIGNLHLKNAFAFIRPDIGTTDITITPDTPAVQIIKALPLEYSAEERKASFYYDKFKASKSSHMDKFDQLIWAYQSMGEKIENARKLGIEPQQFSKMMREYGARAIQESLQKIAEGQGTALDQILHVNNLRIALDYAGIMDDGTNDRVYAEQIAGVDYESLRIRIQNLAPQAARLAIEDVRRIPAHYQDMPDHVLQQTFTKFELINYAFNKPALASVLGKRPEQRHESLGLPQEEWAALNEKWTDMEEYWKNKISSHIPQASVMTDDNMQSSNAPDSKSLSWGNAASPFATKPRTPGS